jgi:diaminohydroxyphosphoribosylaminopyrimidine deaminase/5-amino-6-(5-phosphoribosylamino)uracil reductase
MDADLYVTLEPCSCWGKTPPCTDAIIKAGVRRVVVAMQDPNPRIAGSGIQRLWESGIEVVVNVCSDTAQRLNKRYIASLKNRNPWVIVKAAMSLDGKIATAAGDSKWITGPDSRAYVHSLRSKCDGILVGANTVVKDNPELTSHGKGKNPVRIIIDPGLKIPLKSRVVTDKQAKTVVITRTITERNLKVKLERLQGYGVRVIEIPSKKRQINFKEIIHKLEEMSIYRVFIEGGGETIASALEAGIVNEIYSFYAPILIGGRDAKTCFEGKGVSLVSEAIKVGKMRIKRFKSDLLIISELLPTTPCKTH